MHHESDSAKIRVTILNRGRGAYRHDVYGDSITVERIIIVGQGGDFGTFTKLLDHNLLEQPRPTADLVEMLNAWYDFFLCKDL